MRREETVKGWSTKKMKNKPSSSLVKDTEEMIGGRTMNQEKTAKQSILRQRLLLGMRRVRRSRKY